MPKKRGGVFDAAAATGSAAAAMSAADDAMRRVFSNDPSLVEIDWSRGAVGDASVCLLAEALAKGVNTHLRALDLRDCATVSDASARKLVLALPNCSLVRVALARTKVSADKRTELQRLCVRNQSAADAAAAKTMPPEGLASKIASLQSQDGEAAAALRNRERLEARLAELERGGAGSGAAAAAAAASGGESSGATDAELHMKLRAEVQAHAATKAELEQMRVSLDEAAAAQQSSQAGLEEAMELNEELETENDEKDATIEKLRAELAASQAATRTAQVDAQQLAARLGAMGGESPPPPPPPDDELAAAAGEGGEGGTRPQKPPPPQHPRPTVRSSSRWRVKSSTKLTRTAAARSQPTSWRCCPASPADQSRERL